jgi:hypothetical protein
MFLEESNIKFKSEGSRIQFRFNEEILDDLHKLHKLIPSTDKFAYVAIDLITKLKELNQLIRIADNSTGGWATVREYESSGYADNEQDEKRIRQTENRALRSIKDRKVVRSRTLKFQSGHQSHQQFILLLILLTTLSVIHRRPFGTAPHGVSRACGTSATSASNLDTGRPTVHSTTTSRLQPPTVISKPVLQQNSEATCVNDKYFDYLVCSDSYEFSSNYEFENFLSQVQFLEKLDISCSKDFKGVKGRLAKHIEFWMNIGTSDFVLDTIRNGYVIPFVNPPVSMYFKNNKSALDNSEFVDQAVSELVDSGCVHKVPFIHYVVNPLSVATNKSGKKRLILDLSVLNKSVKKQKFKFEDWKLAIQFFKEDSYLYKFDLRSGYHHFDICPQQQTYLGFSWNGKYFCFTVLVFDLSSSPYLFTKCLREMVKYWRKNAINIVLYLDDGFGMSDSFGECQKDSVFVKQSLVDAGFLINEEKSIFFGLKSLNG